MKKIIRIKNYTVEVLIVVCVLLILLHSSDAIIYPDSIRYLKGNLFDPPLYSSVIALVFMFET